MYFCLFTYLPLWDLPGHLNIIKLDCWQQTLMQNWYSIALFGGRGWVWDGLYMRCAEKNCVQLPAGNYISVDIRLALSNYHDICEQLFSAYIYIPVIIILDSLIPIADCTLTLLSWFVESALSGFIIDPWIVLCAALAELVCPFFLAS